MSTMKNCARIIFGVLGISFLGFRLDATVPAGYYYAADGKHGAELKTALCEIISSMHTLGYGSGEDATWEGFSRTDRKEDGSVWDRYSDEIRYFDGFNAVGGMHIEHSFRKVGGALMKIMLIGICIICSRQTDRPIPLKTICRWVRSREFPALTMGSRR
mgnify:FL=1